MEDSSRYSEDMKIIRKIMEDSTRFLSLSGLSGILAGLIALIGAAVASFIILNDGTILNNYDFNSLSLTENRATIFQLLIDGMLVMISAVVVSCYFSWKKAKKDGKKIWTTASRQMLINLTVPLFAGGFFILAHLIQDHLQLIIPSTLVFYGLALVNAGKYTFDEVFYLGLLEIITGILSIFFNGFDILFWAFGFGALHLVYGIFMFRKYDR